MHNYTHSEPECLQQKSEAQIDTKDHSNIITYPTNNANEKLLKQANKKIFANALGDAYETLGKDKKADRVLHCADYLLLGENSKGKVKIIKANYCKVRLCPNCQARLSKIKYRQLSNAIAQIETVKHYEAVFLTLTVKNKLGEDLRKGLEDILKAYNKLIKKPAFKRSFLGAYRSLEITYNEKKKTFHPHIHVLLLTTKEYFYHKSPLYFTQNRLCVTWQSALGEDYKPVCDIRKPEDTKAELTKYVTKPGDYIDLENPTLTAETVRYLDVALRGLRLHSFSGILKQADKDFKETDYSKEIINEYCNHIKLYKWENELQAYVLK